VTHLCGDALEHPLPQQAFDAVISFLAIVHIPHRPALMKRVRDALRPGGQCYIEDLACRAPFTPCDLDELHRVVHGVSVTSIEDYAGDLRQASLFDVVATDLTDDWAPYAAGRLAGWRRDREAYSAASGQEAWAAQDLFYTVIDRLYRSGSLAGVRLTARA
jgi:SAM-dependent methyltransferase